MVFVTRECPGRSTCGPFFDPGLSGGWKDDGLSLSILSSSKLSLLETDQMKPRSFGLLEAT